MPFLATGKHPAILRAEEEEDEITTVIKETDDDSPNTKTTTIKRAGEKGNTRTGRAPAKGFGLLGLLQQYIAGDVEEEDIWGGGGTVGLAPGGQRGIINAPYYGGQGPRSGMYGAGPEVPGPVDPSTLAGPTPTPGPVGQVLNDTRELGQLVEAGRPDYAGMDASTDPTTDPRWTNPAPTGTQNQPQTYPTGNPWDQDTRSSREYGIAYPNYGRERVQTMGEIDSMMAQQQPEYYGGQGPRDGMYGAGPEVPGTQQPGPQSEMPMYPNPQENSGWKRSPGSSSTYGITDVMPTGRAALAGARDPNDPWPSESWEPPVVDTTGTPQTFTGINSPMSKGPEYYTGQGPRSGMYGAGPEVPGPQQPNANEPPGLTGSRTGKSTKSASGHLGHRVEGTVKGATKQVVDTAEDDQTSYTVQGQQPSMAQSDALTRTWGKLAYDPKKRRDEYMKRLNKIYANTMALEALAIISGKRSRAGMYAEMAMGKLDAMQKFDSEDRLQQLTNSLYFNRNGEYAPPANKAEAHAALMQMGASLNEATAIVGHVPEAVSQDLKEWYRYNPETNQVETRQYPGKKGSPGAGWNQKYEVANNKWKNANPDSNQDVLGGTDAEKGIKETQLINALAMVEPGSTEHANIKTQLNSLRQQIYGDPADAFKDLFPAETREGAIPGSYQELLGKNGTYAQAMQHFMDPNNYDKLSYNYYRGWTPAQQGAVTGVVTNANYANAEEALAAIKEGKHQVGEKIIVGGVEKQVE